MGSALSVQDAQARAERVTRNPLQSSAIRLLYPLFTYKVFILWLVLASAQLLPNTFSQEGYKANFHWPPDRQSGWSERFMTWDAEHYLHLSQQGYQAGSSSAAFYPLWPALIRMVGKLFGGHDLIASLALANIFSLAAWVLFHCLVRLEHGEELADWATVFLIAFPGSIFFQLPYTESLFLLLVLAFFWGITSGNSYWIAAAGFFLPLTRAVGLLCALPLAIHYWIEGRRWREWWPILAIIAGWSAYLAVMGILTGNLFEGFTAQRHYVAGASILKLIDPIGFMHSLFTPLQLHGFLNSAFDRLFFFCFVVALVPLYRLSKVYFTYSAALGVVPAVTNSFMSCTRYLAVVFPLFIIASQYYAIPARKYWRCVVVVMLLAVQLLFFLRHINFYWAG